VEKIEGVLATSPVVWGEAILKFGDRTRGVLVKGIDFTKEKNVTALGKYIQEETIFLIPEEGEEKDFTEGIFLGKELANSLGILPLDTVTLISPSLKHKQLLVKGIFNSGLYEYDNSLLLMSFSQLQDLLEMGNKFSAIQVKVDNIFTVSQIRQKIKETLPPLYVVKTWQEMDKTFYSALKLEKITMFTILTLIVLVAAFNIASTLVMMVMEKRRGIGILKAIGASSSDIRIIFTLEGLIIGLLGIVLGCAGGYIISFLLKTYPIISLPEEIYSISHLPVKIEKGVFLLVSGVALLISFLATIYPAHRASRMEVQETLRYE